MNSAIPLIHAATMAIKPSSPFNFDATFHKPDHFPAADNEWLPGVRRQTMRWAGEPLGLTFTDRGTADQPAVELDVYARRPLEESFLSGLEAEIGYRYNFQLDLDDFYSRFAAHPLLGPLLTRWRGMRPLNHNDLYEYLIIAILLQNATVRRSVQMMQALFENFGDLLAFDGRELTCFWPPERLVSVDEAALRALKVGYRAKGIGRISQSFYQGEINERELRGSSKEGQRRALLALYGIGPASVEYILFDVFHHLDSISHISPWEQKIYSKLFFDVDPDEPVAVEQLLTYFHDAFAGYEALAVHYIWEDLFWRRKTAAVPWLEKLIRL